MKQQTFDHGEAICNFQQYSVNEPRNQVVRSTLARLAQAGEFGPDVATADALSHRLRWLVRNLNGVDIIDLDLESVRRLVVAHNENDYRLIAVDLRADRDATDATGNEGTHALPNIDRELLILHRVYERFVANFYRMHLTSWDVSA